MTAMVPENQHYVPKLLLRGFLCPNTSGRNKEQVHVFDIAQERSFITSIKNIMAERRFNEWWIDKETIESFEPATSRIESDLAPLVDRIRTERRMQRTPETITSLALLMSFQFMRTKKMRELPVRMDEQLDRALNKRGFKLSQFEGWEPLRGDALKIHHTKHQIKNLKKYTAIFAQKEFFLISAPEGDHFYLGDSPVVMHNDEAPRGFLGSLGLEVPYIQLYLPISSSLVLCAFSKEIFGQQMLEEDESLRKLERDAFAKVASGEMTAERMKTILDTARSMNFLDEMLDKVREGLPVEVEKSQVQFCNSLQAFHAQRYVVDQNGDFAIARDMIAERIASENRE